MRALLRRLLVPWRTWRKRQDCWHHAPGGKESWVESQLINAGAGKMFWCRICGRSWFA